MKQKESHVLFDPACQDLAEHFLQDEKFINATMAVHMARVRSLSQAIQVAVEDWCADCPYVRPETEPHP